MAQAPLKQSELAPAERLAHLNARLTAFRRVRAEFEDAAVDAADAGNDRNGSADGQTGLECFAEVRDARWQVGTVRAAQATLAVLGKFAAFREIARDQHVGHELLGAAVQRAPACRRRNPQPMAPLLLLLAEIPGSDLPDDAALVDPQIPLRPFGLERQDAQLGRLAHERVRLTLLARRAVA